MVILHNRILRHRKSTKNNTLCNINLIVLARSMKGILMLFEGPDRTNSWWQGLCGGGRTSPCPSQYCRFYFLVLWDHGFHCGTLKLLEGHWWSLNGRNPIVLPNTESFSKTDFLLISVFNWRLFIEFCATKHRTITEPPPRTDSSLSRRGGWGGGGGA